MTKNNVLSFLTKDRLLYIPIILATLVFLPGCHTSKKQVRNKGVRVESVHHNHKQAKGLERRLVDEAMTWRGTPYRYGGSEKGRGCDCSGLVVSVYDKVAGIKLPRNSKQQSEFCKKINKNAVRPGDLVFFATGKDPKKVSHVGIMIDDNRFIHASGSKGVIVSEMSTPYYSRTFLMYGKVP